MHILMTVNAAWNIWNFRQPVVRALLGDGQRVSVLAPPDDSVGDLVGLGCRFLPLEMDVKGLNPIRDLRLISRLRQVYRTARPDAILSYTIKNNIYGALAAQSLDIPFVPNITGLGTAFQSGGALRVVVEGLYRRAFNKLPIVFFQNTDDRDLFVSRHLVRPDQARVLPGSGIDLVRFAATDLPSEAEAPVFLMIARLLRDKGVLEFVEAARAVRAHIPGARFQLLGTIGSENRTAIDATAVEAWQQEGAIEYLGTAADVRPFIAAAHCAVLPSYREGAPRTLIEAAAMARPLIATDVPGCRSVVDHGVTGFLCKVRDSKSLAAACLRFLELPHAGKVAMGRAGRAKMEREFDQGIVIDAYRSALADSNRVSAGSA